MTLNRLNYTYTSYIKNFLVLSLLMFSIVSIAISNPILASESDSVIKLNSISSSKSNTVINRVKINNNPIADASSHVSPESFINTSSPNFAIGSQNGIGGGTYSVSDSFNWTGTESLSTQNSIDIVSDLPTNKLTSLTISTPTDYIREYGLFNITNVQSESDWRLIEDYEYTRTPYNSNPLGFDYVEVAMSFTPETLVNLTRVRTYTVSHQSACSGTIYIVNSTAGGAPNSSDILSSKETLMLTGEQWDTYTFDNPILLQGGHTYYVVMNDTNTISGRYWDWYYQNDISDDGIDEGTVYYKQTLHSGSWFQWNLADIPLQIEVLPVTYNSSNYVAKKYFDPTVLGFSYNTSVKNTTLSSLEWFTWDATETHIFRTNTSVSFTLDFIANYSYYLNPFSAIPSYFTTNNSNVNWNLTFSTPKLNTTYNIENHLVKVIGLEQDWNGTEIYWNDSIIPEYSNLINNVNVTWDGNPLHKYIHGNATIVVNASKLAENTTWHLWLEAPNYIETFTLSTGGVPLGFPYTTYTMNDYTLDFQVGKIGNLTYWIEYPNGSQLIRYNINPVETQFNDLWDIDTTFDDVSEINGTYYLQAFWNNSDLTKVGTYTRFLDMYVNTSISTVSDLEVVIGDLFNISASYKSLHNDSDILNAPIFAEANWTTDVYMNQLGDNSYNASFATNTRTAGQTGTITVTTQLRWFENWTEQITVRFVESSALEVNTTLTLSLEWRENTSLIINYTDSSSVGISGANITVDGDTFSAYWDGIDEVYIFRFNSTKYGGMGTYPDLSITATHDNYLNQQWLFTLIITEGITNIIATEDLNSLDNDSTVVVKSYANSNADQLILNFHYYHELSSLNLDTDEPIIESPFPDVSPPVEESDLSWTIRLNPNQTGNFLINVSYSLPNFSDALFIVHVTIENAKTSIETTYTNGTNIFYENFYDFMLIYNNTDYNEKIIFNGNDTILISAPLQVNFLGRTGDEYNFRFASTPLGVNSYSILITFQHEYYDDASILILINVVPGPTTITGADTNGTAILNNTETYWRYFSPNEFDNFSISLNYSALLTTNTIPVTSSNIIIEAHSSIFITYFIDGSNNWTFIFNASLLGSYLINITFSHFNYSTSTFTLMYVILPAGSNITEYSTNLTSGPVNASVKSGNSIEIWMVWRSQYGESINDINGVMSSNDTLLVFLNSTEVLGIYYHYFRYTAAGIGVDTIDLTFGTVNYTDIVITLNFEVTDRELVINNVLSTHANSWTSPVGYLQYGDRYYFSIFINDSEDGTPVDITVFTGLNTYNITFVNVSSGNHLFYYEAWIIATVTSVSLSIQFIKANYQSDDYYINFFVKPSESIIAAAPPSVITFYSQNLNFTILWQSQLNPNAPFTPIYGINSSDITSPLPVILKDVTDGNYTFEVIANQTGVFTITLNFMSAFFVDKNYQLTVMILQVPTEFGVTTPSNASQVGMPTGLYYTDTFDFTIGWLSSFNGSGIQDTSPIIVVTGSGNVEFLASFSNGSHMFKIYTETLGQYQVTITLETANFGKLVYVLDYKVSNMPTLPLIAENITLDDAIYVEDAFKLNGSGYQTYGGVDISSIDTFVIWLNGTLVESSQIQILNNSYYFEINVTTVNFAYGFYNVSFLLNTTGYQAQMINLTINLLGRSLNVAVSLPVSTIQQGEDITINVILSYTNNQVAGLGSTSLLAPWTDIIVHYYIEMDFANSSTKILEADMNFDALGHASYLIDKSITKSAVGFSNITVFISGSRTSLPTSYSMSAEELAAIKITEFLDPLEILIPALIVLVIVAFIVTSVYYVNRRRVSRSQVKKFAEMSVEQGFEDIKSIRLILARHQSGLQFYSEKTIAELQTDTDALSGMSAALSSFMEELSESMTSQSEEEAERDKIEFLSREGLHMLIWHGYHSSLIIISEIRLPEYFQTHLKALGHELEDKYTAELQDFYSSDQIPNTVVKKMVRKYIPLHYFSAYVLNEGVLTLESVKLSRKYMKMFNEIKKVMFKIEGAHYFFSEQIISHLTKKYKRSEAIKFLDHAININLLIEAEQKDLLQLTKL